jgi:hypothetical protein
MKTKVTETKIVYYSSITIICIMIFLLFTSCKVRKEIVETHSTDTIYKNSIIKIDKPQLNTIKIENVCDSLGRLKMINYTSTSNNAKTTLKTVDNSLVLEVNIDSIVNSKVNEYKSSLKTEKQVIIKEVKRPLNLWVLLYAIATTLWIIRRPLMKLIKTFIIP